MKGMGGQKESLGNEMKNVKMAKKIQLKLEDGHQAAGRTVVKAENTRRWRKQRGLGGETGDPSEQLGEADVFKENTQALRVNVSLL